MKVFPKKSETHNRTDSIRFFGKENRHPFFSPNTIQSKLIIGQSKDKYVQEADAMADKVMSMPDENRKEQINKQETEGDRPAPTVPEETGRPNRSCRPPRNVELVRTYRLAFPDHRTGGGICAVMRVLPTNNLCMGTGIHEAVSLARGGTCPTTLLSGGLCSGNSVFHAGRNQSRACAEIEIPSTGFIDRHTVQVHTSVLHDRTRNPRNLDSCSFTCNQRYFVRNGRRERNIGRFQIIYNVRKDRRGGQNVSLVTATKRRVRSR